MPSDITNYGYIDKIAKFHTSVNTKSTNMANAFKKARGKENITPSLKNKNITVDTKIPFVIAEEYIEVPKNDKTALSKLQQKVKQLPRGTYKNEATGYEADINGKTIGKILNPKPNFNPWGKNYTDNLNAAIYLPKLFENAVYIDTIENQKSKNTNKQIKGFHHFIAPITMKENNYRVKITAREKENSNILYIIDTEILQNKEDVTLPNNMDGNFLTTSSETSIPDLIKDVKIYDYDMQENKSYTQENLKYSLVTNKVTIPCPTEREPSRKGESVFTAELR